MRYPNRWTIGEWTFYEVADHGFSAYGDKSLYGWTLAVPDGTAAGKPKLGELYGSLDHAMVAAVGEKHTSKRGAMGTGVGTAADWFMKMIGAGQLQEAGQDGRMALTEAVREHAGRPMSTTRIERALEEKGFVLARQPIE